MRSVNFVVDASEGGGRCELSGGGTNLGIQFSRYQESEFTWDEVARGAAEPGSTPISLGPAEGYLSEYGAALFVACPYSKGPRRSAGRPGRGGGMTEIRDRDTKEKVAALTADVMRAVARELERCEGAGDLPDGSPKVG
ncbi:hypothetical protein [Streptomyces sp. NBC_01506]|uniref:hypothetical protein n=1 Tax=Streptomyces sp. NBC_01506 TaxID=2903887 RepID=UPI003868B021